MILQRQIEEQPDSWPPIDSTSSVPESAIWQRIEQWIAWRWPERKVTWLVEGDGVFRPPLLPWKVTKVEVFAGCWQDTEDYTESPIGLYLPYGLSRITADVGDNTTEPPAVMEAAARLMAYMQELAESPFGEASAVTNFSQATAKEGDLTLGFSRTMKAKAQALQLSGAADLLRPWRYA